MTHLRALVRLEFQFSDKPPVEMLETQIIHLYRQRASQATCTGLLAAVTMLEELEWIRSVVAPRHWRMAKCRPYSRKTTVHTGLRRCWHYMPRGVRAIPSQHGTLLAKASSRDWVAVTYRWMEAARTSSHTFTKYLKPQNSAGRQREIWLRARGAL